MESETKIVEVDNFRSLKQNGAGQLALFDNRLEPLLTANEVAVRLSISAKTVYSMAKQGRLNCVRVGRAVRFKPKDIDDIVSGSRFLF